MLDLEFFILFLNDSVISPSSRCSLYVRKSCLKPNSFIHLIVRSFVCSFINSSSLLAVLDKSTQNCKICLGTILVKNDQKQSV